MRYNRQIGIPYVPPHGGLLTMINNKYTHPNNITKIPTNLDISPYFQIIKINNAPLTPIPNVTPIYALTSRRHTTYPYHITNYNTTNHQTPYQPNYTMW
jgi:hypothetical protein